MNVLHFLWQPGNIGRTGSSRETFVHAGKRGRITISPSYLGTVIAYCIRAKCWERTGVDHLMANLGGYDGLKQTGPPDGFAAAAWCKSGKPDAMMHHIGVGGVTTKGVGMCIFCERSRQQVPTAPYSPVLSALVTAFSPHCEAMFNELLGRLWVQDPGGQQSWV